MNKHTIIGTAGHIDHGKTTLIKALTGIDADRLKEEKERGITIDIGFAYWRDDVTIMDVPGHEKFIRNMVAGVSTIDFFLLVIAADDGIMPQTIEHLDILNFFNIRDGIVVLNKIDLVDPEWCELVRQDIISLLTRYHLGHLPVIPVSAVQNINIGLLLQHMEAKINSIHQRICPQPFRLLIDRSFQIKGFGTVVTGTVLSGTLDKGDEVEIYPARRKVKVRGIQIHTHDTSRVETGYRAAVNLPGISKDEIKRGDVLALPDSMVPVTEFSGIMRTVSHLPLKIKNRSKVHVYTGTAERLGQIFWYDDSRYLEPNHDYHIRIKLFDPVSAARLDAFLIRLHSPVLTLAGGKIAEINPARLSASGKNWNDYFNIMQGRDLFAIIEKIIQTRGLYPVSSQILRAHLFEPAGTFQTYIAELQNRKKIVSVVIKGTEHFIHTQNMEQLHHQILNFINIYHHQNPLKPGINLKELCSSLEKQRLSGGLVEACVNLLLQEKKIVHAENVYSLPDFSVQISRDPEQSRTAILEKLKAGNFSPPDIDELAHQLEMPSEEIRLLLTGLVKEGRVISINQKFYLHAEVWDRLIRFLQNYFSTQIQMPVAALKEFIATTRKYAIPIFEYLDSSGLTVRAGDSRKKGPAM